jgi:2-dehydropantoate 2-reductase
MEAIHIIGAGGIGCAIGYALRAAKVPVVFVDTNSAKVEAGRREGVRVDNRPTLPAKFVHFDDWTPNRDALVLLCTKCFDNAAVLTKLPASTNLIPIQNGFDPQLHAFGHEWEGIASFISECAQDRPHTHITRKGDLHLGRFSDGSTASELAMIASALSKSRLFKVKLVTPIKPIKYAKLMYNSAISPLAAAAGIDNGKLLSVSEARELFFALLQENYCILSASGIKLGKVGPFQPRTVAWILRRKGLAKLMAKFFEPSLRGTYCSMAGEIQKGRTEIDNYNGHLIRLAEQTGTPCPLNRAVYDLVTKMTAERAAPNLGVLQDMTATLRTAPQTLSV